MTLAAPKEASKLVKLWRAVHGSSHYPILAADLALEWSKQVAKDYITEVVAREVAGIEGGLFPLASSGKWAIIYRPHSSLPGRENYTVAHELGHFVLHRSMRSEFRCSQRDTLGSLQRDIEREAEEFASYLLMPIDEFHRQVSGSAVDIDVLSACASHFRVSLTAAILKWLSFTEKAAIVVFARDGMLLWWRSSDSARSLAFQHLSTGMEMPAGSLVSEPSQFQQALHRSGVLLRENVWFPSPTREMLITSDRYDLTISLLMPESEGVAHEEELLEDLTTSLPTFGKRG